MLPPEITISYVQSLKEAFAAKIPVWQDEIKTIKKMYGDKVLGTCTVEQVSALHPSYQSFLHRTDVSCTCTSTLLYLPQCHLPLRIHNLVVRDRLNSRAVHKEN